MEDRGDGAGSVVPFCGGVVMNTKYGDGSFPLDVLIKDGFVVALEIDTDPEIDQWDEDDEEDDPWSDEEEEEEAEDIDDERFLPVDYL
jgi:hypothetical protein